MKNRTKVESSICKCLVKKASSSSCACYFKPHVKTQHCKVSRNDNSGEDIVEHLMNLSIFKHSSRKLGKTKIKYLTEENIGQLKCKPC